ncbi:MAG: anthranilate synthase component I [Candidatus Omnitrophica bacterium]|nr:anthranilate synthase component I [Candidatus Omnitrophota bacterium]
MILSPDFSTFSRLARKGNLIAVQFSIPADLETPVSAYLKLAHKEEHSFLLESAEQGEKVGRYSFIGLKPSSVISSEAKQSQARKIASSLTVPCNDTILDLLEKNISKFKLANPETLPDFCGGYVGFLSYENVRDFEQVKLQEKPGPKIPQSVFFLTREFLVFDHFRKNLSIVILADTGSSASLKTVYAQTQVKIESYLKKLSAPLKQTTTARSSKSRFVSNMKPAQYYAKVNRIKEYIRAGDCIQTVLSQRFQIPASGDDFQIYRALRSINPSPYMFYFRSGDLRLIGSSPELLVKKKGRMAEVRPIAGTRPRGKNQEDDQHQEENLKRSKKEAAEHLMLVDLGRNDLGRVCEFSTIQVKNFARVERYSHVMHLVSDVEGRLKSGKTAFDLLKATFPAGTVTGAPKIRAMEIINELEPEKRGPYAGCLGYFSFNQNMDMCITIRTLVNDGKKIYLQAGAGIVKDSNPRREYQETVNKAKALLKAVEIRNDF